VLSKLRAYIAYLGTNVQFLANVGHFAVPYAVIATYAFFNLKYRWGHPEVVWYLGGAFVIYAAIKEYYFDARYEVPHQTFWDNTRDFAGYCLGSGVACLVFK
jgi:hypothetical protein